jgi:glycosyltransferase involved in cell wall biosynthesis
MKILMLNPSFSGSGYTHNLCNALAAQGCDVHLFTGPHWTTSSGHWPEVRYRPRLWFYRRTQERSYRPGIEGLVWKLFRLTGHIWQMVRLAWTARRFDVVHVQFLGVPALDLVWLWVVSRYRPLIYTVHNLYPHDAARNGWTHWLGRATYRAPAALIAHTRATAAGLRESFGSPAARVAQVRFGNYGHLGTMTHALTPKEIGLDRPGVILLFGDVRRNKGIDVLLAATARLKATSTNFLVVIAGGRGGSQPYQELARQLGVTDVVEFRTRYVEEHEVPAYLRAAALVVLPYRTIDQSAVAVAACSMGKTLVASDIAGLREIVREADNGILVPPEDPQTLAAALARVLADPDLRARYEANSLRYARETLAWSPIARDTVALYERVLATRTLRAPHPEAPDAP